MLRRIAWAIAACLAGCGDPQATTQPATPSTTSRPAAARRPPPRPPVEPPDAEPFPARVHVVAANETLIQIAQKYYGDGQRHWRRVFYANHHRIRDPRDLPVGMKLIIPPPP